jgi:hypothetical protein
VVLARKTFDVISVSISGAGSLIAAVAVTAGISVIVPYTEASIRSGATVTAGGNVVVSAEDQTFVDVVTANIAGGGPAAAIGFAGGVSVLKKTTEGLHRRQRAGHRTRPPRVPSSSTAAPSRPARRTTSRSRRPRRRPSPRPPSTPGRTGSRSSAHGFTEGQEVVYSRANRPVARS